MWGFIMRILFFLLMLFTFSRVCADEQVGGAGVPYRLVEGGQYEICEKIFSIVNSYPPGSLRSNAASLKEIEGLELPSWQAVDGGKYLDLIVKYQERWLGRRLNENEYAKKYRGIQQYIDSGKLKIFKAKIDIDNTGMQRSILKTEGWSSGRRNEDNYTYFSYDQDSMELDRRYRRLGQGELIFFRGRTFRFVEWFHKSGGFNYWQIGVDEPYYLKDRSPDAYPPVAVKHICKFIAN